MISTKATTEGIKACDCTDNGISRNYPCPLHGYVSKKMDLQEFDETVASLFCGAMNAALRTERKGLLLEHGIHWENSEEFSNEELWDNMALAFCKEDYTKLGLYTMMAWARTSGSYS